MPAKYSVVIADTNCFILLDKINEVELLRKVFDTVTTTKEIADEFNKPLPGGELAGGDQEEIINPVFVSNCLIL